MKKIIFLIILIILLVTAYYVNNSSSTIKQELRDFAVQDTSSITKVFFADRWSNTVTIEKKDGTWLVDGKYNVRKDAIKYLLSTMKDLEVKHPVSNSMHDKIIKHLSSSAVKVEIFMNDSDQIFKTYYVGGESKDMIGSYMLLEHSSRAFVVYLPGFNGFLAPRYNIDGTVISTDLWRDRTLFEYQPNDIKSVQVIHHEDSTKSFTIKRDKEGFLLIKNGQQKNITENNGNTYFKLFEKVNCEGYMNDFTKKDSIINSKPFYTITVNSVNKGSKILNCYHKPPKRESYMQENGQKQKYDVDRMYASLANDFMLIQFYVFDKILLRAPHFNVEN